MSWKQKELEILKGMSCWQVASGTLHIEDSVHLLNSSTTPCLEAPSTCLRSSHHATWPPNIEYRLVPAESTRSYRSQLAPSSPELRPLRPLTSQVLAALVEAIVVDAVVVSSAGALVIRAWEVRLGVFTSA